jgi:hypothetical protein
MMFLFVAMIHFPGALHSHNNRIIWTIVFREMSFSVGGWLLAATAYGRAARTRQEHPDNRGPHIDRYHRSRFWH